jgi:hypothetical protein
MLKYAAPGSIRGLNNPADALKGPRPRHKKKCFKKKRSSHSSQFRHLRASLRVRELAFPRTPPWAKNIYPAAKEYFLREAAPRPLRALYSPLPGVLEVPSASRSCGQGYGVCGWLAAGHSYSSDLRGQTEADNRLSGRDWWLVSSSWGRHVTVRGMLSSTMRFCGGNDPRELSEGNRIMVGALSGA